MMICVEKISDAPAGSVNANANVCVDPLPLDGVTDMGVGAAEIGAA
jgi:hypothetical protein